MREQTGPTGQTTGGSNLDDSRDRELENILSLDCGSVVEEQRRAEPVQVSTAACGIEDYFGYVVVSAVSADMNEASRLEELEVRGFADWSDSRLHRAADKITADIFPVSNYGQVLISPLKLAEMLERHRNKEDAFKAILAWAHARAIEQVPRISNSEGIPVWWYPQQGGFDDEYVRRRLAQGGHSLRIIHDPGVHDLTAACAAFIVGQSRYLRTLTGLNKTCHFTLPRGMGPDVIGVGKHIVANNGIDTLRQVAKVCYRLTDQILGVKGNG